MVALSRFVLALWVTTHYGSAIQLRPGNCTHQLCVDFGSSGAKFSDCKEKSKADKFPSNGAGAFARTAKMSKDGVLETKLEAYLTKQGLPMDKATTCVAVCGGTAGNRFKHLVSADADSWNSFNTALAKFATIPAGTRCRTFSGTEEATYEWAFTGYSPVFVGIGGASMQLHLPSGKGGNTCPDLFAKPGPSSPTLTAGTVPHFDGGVGASTAADFCKVTEEPGPGVLWSLLADREFNKGRDEKLHIFGGMNEVAERFYHILKAEKFLVAATIKQGPLAWVEGVIEATALSDPMWLEVLKGFHGPGCAALPESEDIVFLANPSLGQTLLNSHFVGHAVKNALMKLLNPRVTPTQALAHQAKSSRARMRSLFRPQRLRTESDLLRHTIQQMSGHETFEQIAEEVASACREAVEAHSSHGKERREFFTEFDGTNPKKVGFLCTVKVFTLSWLSTLAGYNKRTPGLAPWSERLQCFKSNFQKLLGARHMKGDWMSGALTLLG